MITIDGSQGEGGGQILRSSLALSVLTGKAFELKNIRAGRKRPGLLRQHLAAVRAAREISAAGLIGDELNSVNLQFAPGPTQTRGFRFDVGSAGSATLVAQTIIPPLMVASGNSSIEIEGGTHNMAAPPWDFLQRCYLPLISRMGPTFDSSILAHGFYPAGGGRIRLTIEPVEELSELNLLEHKGTLTPKVTALVSKLPTHIGEREVDVVRRKADWPRRVCEVIKVEDSPGPGNVVMIEARYDNVTELFTGFGRRGVKAEQVAVNAWTRCKQYLAHEAPVGEFLADQLMLPMAIAASRGKTSRFWTGPLSRHSQTHIDIIRLFLDVDIQVTSVGSLQHEVQIGPNIGSVAE